MSWLAKFQGFLNRRTADPWHGLLEMAEAQEFFSFFGVGLVERDH